MQDADSSVREAASEGLCAVARGMAEAGTTAPGQTASQHPVVKVLMDAMSDGKRELQTAACNALGMVRWDNSCDAFSA